MTPAEQNALGRAAVVLLVAGAVRWGVEWHRGPPVEVPGREDVLPELLQEARALQDEQERRDRPLAEGEILDLNGASEVELDRLPGVGPATARALVETREGRGGFRRVEDVLEVRGIGPATLEKLRPHVEVGPLRVTAGGAAAGGARGSGGPGAAAGSGGAAGFATSGGTGGIPVTDAAPPGAGSARSTGTGSGTSGSGPPPTAAASAATPLDLNTATEAQLIRLPGIGPALAGRILAERQKRGGFREVEELVEVRGIGPATLERIRALVRVR